MKRYAYAALLLAALAMPSLAEISPAFINGQNDFAADLYKRLAAGESGNVFFSPYSISSALAMTYGGAAGPTAREMARALKLEGVPDPHAQLGELTRSLNDAGSHGQFALSVANALWGAQGTFFSKSFVELARERYGAGLAQLDFKRDVEGSRKTINAWVEQQTQYKIKDLLAPGTVSARTRLVLTNAIYFKGRWTLPFTKSFTRDADFHVTAQKTVKAPFMAETKYFAYGETPELQILELPYKGDRLSMVVLLPRDASGLPALEKELSGETLARWLAPALEQRVEVFLPRFKATSSFQLKDALIALGMKTAFVPVTKPPTAAQADFSGMDGRRDFWISEAVHKAFVDVNEQGTEAAAATAVTMLTGAAAVGTPPVIFRADHPFLYLIRDRKTGAVLFLGRLQDPTE